MDTKLATTQIRLASWARIIKARKESGLSVKEYCEQNDLSRGAYFYWLRKLRTAALETEGNRFVELLSPVHPDEGGSPASQVIVEVGDARIHISDPYARDTFAMILEVLRYAK